MPAREFSRTEIYEIRERALRETAPQIARDFPNVSVETLRRIIRRETYREIGVGPTERPEVSNRLRGEDRAPGDPAPTPEEIAASHARILEEMRQPLPSAPDPLAIIRAVRGAPPRDAYDIPEPDDVPPGQPD